MKNRHVNRQNKPNLSCVASGEAGLNPTSSELVEPISEPANGRTGHKHKDLENKG
jgi:hypothetical protein